MNPDLFFENFELFADAPNGIQKLRELILQFAIMGKLVEQDLRDEPASILSEENIKSLKYTHENKKLFECPKGWILTSMDQVSKAIHYGYTASANNSLKDVRLLRITDIQNNKVNWETVPGCEIDEQRLNSYVLNDNDLLIARTGGTIGKSYLVENLTVNAVFASYLIRIVPNKLIFPKYLKLYADSSIYWDQLYSKCSGTGQPNVNATSLKSLIIPLPHLAEQKRIVTKVDELMAFCDKLETHRQKKQELQSKLNSAALDRMFSAENQEDFEHYWQRICENFDLIYNNPENVEKLKKYILKLGVEGKLVTQESEVAKKEGRSYESADNLLKNALINRDEKEVNLKNINNFENSELSNSDETLPVGWIWTKIGQVTECLDHIRVPINKKEREERIGNIPYYGANGRVGWIDSYIFDEPLVLVVEDETFIGRQKPFCYKIAGKSWVNNHAHVLRPTEAVDVDFLNYSLSYYPFIPLTSGTTGRKKLTKSTLIAAPYKLPPLAEQKRIVEKVEQLMGLCDELEAKLRKEREESQKLVEAVVKGLLENYSTTKSELDRQMPMQEAVIRLK